MTDREKLVELISSVEYKSGWTIGERYYRDWIVMVADQLIAKGVTVRRWISVKDRLPDNAEDVLCWYEDENNREWVTVGKCFDGGWDLDIDCLGERCLTVTHWQPLPEPPKEVPHE